MRNLLKALAAVACIAIAGPAAAVSYVYVGSWDLGEGPSWTTNPGTYSGIETAALLFGGSPGDYAISTIDDNPANINFSTWLDGWADPNTYALNGTPAAEVFSLDLTGMGYDGCNVPGQVIPCFQSAYSAYVQDHFTPGSGFTNYAFSTVVVPLPAAGLMLLGGIGGLLAVGRRRIG